MAKDPEILAHLEWLGYVQPVGLVVSVPAMVAAGAYVTKSITPVQQKLLACLPRDKSDELIPEIRDWPTFVETVLEWRPSDLISAIPDSLEVVLPEYGETLRPTYVVADIDDQVERSWSLLIQVVPPNVDLDVVHAAGERNWQATPQAKFERLLREAQVPTGLLSNGRKIRLVYSPRGESSGHATFSVTEMASVAGRPILAALRMLLGEERLFSLPAKKRLPAILAESRKYQNTVSTQLAEQVLAALYELLRGFQAADAKTKGELLRTVLAEDPDHVYSGLLTVLLRLVFLLYAEDRGVMSADEVYVNNYAVTGLFERLRADAGRYPDTMDQRYGAWAQLLTLFRLVHSGGRHGLLRLPARKGFLFDPDRYPFLEGRTRVGDSQAKIVVPGVPDGVVFRILTNLRILDGEHLSYRSLDVEQIGSVYESVMGFRLEVAKGPSIAIKSKKPHGAPLAIDLDELLKQMPGERTKWLKASADQEATGQSADAVKKAESSADLVAALERKIARTATPDIVPPGTMLLQPSDERRKSGSHYTPRSLTEPIVRTTLRPILEQLGEKPNPERILDLKICDPAMGSGAFLVEACRQLGEQLVKGWHAHGKLPFIPPDEDEVLHAQRLVAQRCLYGVDKNPLAVDLAKLSLWLTTLAKDHPFTFLDHALRHGDSLVGLTREQIGGFHWDEVEAAKRFKADEGRLFGDPIAERIRRATEARQRILAARDEKPYEQLRQELDVADDSLKLVRLAGDLVIAAFFSAAKDRERVNRLNAFAQHLVGYLDIKTHLEYKGAVDSQVASLHSGSHPIHPFHWEVEFPEVFTLDKKATLTGGFDAFVGNPPFAGKNTLINGNREGYLDWLKSLHEESHGNADLVAHFFRRAFNLLRSDGCFGLIATNTIGQGDTRQTGLCWICTHGGTIYNARKRRKWPGQAAVVVSVVHICHGLFEPPFFLDDREVPIITAYLFHAGGHENPATLNANAEKCFQGSIVLGMGFTFDDTDTSGVANPTSLMQELIAKDPHNAERIFTYIGGDEVNSSPLHSHNRFIINFGSLSFAEASRWPDLFRIVETKVKPQRETDNRELYRRFWWHFAEKRPGLYQSLVGSQKVIVRSLTSAYFATFTFASIDCVFDQTLIVFLTSTHSGLCTLCCRVHETWTLFFGGTLEDRPRYNVADCFETFPFPDGVLETRTSPPNSLPIQLRSLESTGREYHEFRAALMVRTNEGMTKTYNRFHDPDEQLDDVKKLRELHAAMDRAVLEAYGWHDLAQSATCQFLLDYEEDEDEEPTGRRRKKPWRYRWPDDFRDEVLARLLALNAERAAQERSAAKSTMKSPKPTATKGRKKAATTQVDLFEGDRLRFYIRMVLRGSDKPLTRHALETCLILMFDDDLRRRLLGQRKKTPKSKTRPLEGLDHYLQELELRSQIAIDNSGPQQIVRIHPTAPATDDTPEEDRRRLEEVKQCVALLTAENQIVDRGEYIDAKPDVILAR